MSKPERKVLSLFTGAGGLDLGLEAAGFGPTLCVELDKDARQTLHLNRPGWKLSEPGDIHLLAPSEILEQAGLKARDLDLLAGGPPCQPFSKAGYWSTGDAKRLADPRSNTLRAYLEVVRAALPTTLLVENVKGLTFEGKDEGLKLLLDGLREINLSQGVNYQPCIFTLNAADYGVPQLRERVFIIANINGKQLKVPAPTHGPRAGADYMNAWDAIGDLDSDSWPDELNSKGKWAPLLPSIPEGKNYLWHTPRNKPNGGEGIFGWRTRYWSFLLKLAKDQPSWTLQAYPGPATGPFHWRNRLLSATELARLQTFPDEYRFSGNLRAAYRQIGNAVPSALGELLGLEIRRQHFDDEVGSNLSLIPRRREGRPAPEPIRAVPIQYMSLVAEHVDHPGTGFGPGALLREEAQ